MVTVIHQLRLINMSVAKGSTGICRELSGKLDIRVRRNYNDGRINISRVMETNVCHIR